MIETITSIDFQILNLIQETLRCAFMDAAMAVFSYLGEAGAIWVLTGIVLLLFRKTRAAGVMLLTAVALGFLVGEVGIKNIVCRVRPFYFNTDLVMNIHAPSGYSFPSGHSCSSFAAAFVLLQRFKEKHFVRQWWVGIAAYAVAILIAFSRLYNYVHYPSDVLAGIVLGTLSALLVCFIFHKLRWDEKLSAPLKIKGREIGW